MKPSRPQPTSYKNFIQQISSKNSKQEKSPINKPERKPIQLVRKGKHNNSTQILPSSKSSSLWEKSSSKKTWVEEPSIQSKNISHNQSLAQGEGGKRQNISEKDKTICYHKFINEITSILLEIIKLKNPQFLNHKISYIEFLEVLKGMKMIKDSYEPFPNDLVSELWSEMISGGNIGNFIIVISIILGFQYQKITENDRQIKAKYEKLKFTRLELSSRNTAKPKLQSPFMPQISQRSQELATSRSKSKQKSARHFKCLNTDRVHTSMSGFGVVGDEIDENICINSRQLKGNSLDKTGNKRSQILYKMAKEKSLEKKKDKTTNEVEYEKSIKELTLKPKVHRYKSKENLGKKKIKGEQNTISRMIRGRVERQVMRNIKEKGLPYNDKIVHKMKQQKYEEIITNFVFNDESEEEAQTFDQKPIDQIQPETAQKQSKKSHVDLRIDVYIAEDHKEELIVQKGDYLAEVAQKFIKQHNINEEKLGQLIQLLQKSMSQVLLPIDEMAEQEEQELLSARGQKKNIYNY